jgi:hypothetical protein
MDRVCPHPGGCTKYIFWCILYASCDAAKCFSGLIQIYISKILLEDSWKCAIYKNFVLWQCTECAHNLEHAKNASCDAATLFSGLTQIYINTILLEDSWQRWQVIRNNFLLWQCTECAHILEYIESASRDPATWFSGLVLIYINTILLKAGKWSLQMIYDNFLLSKWTECAHILVDAQSAVCDAEYRVGPHLGGCCKCISWCSHMVLRVNVTGFSGWRERWLGRWRGKLPNR